MKKIVIISVIALASFGCSNAFRSSFKSWGAKHQIQLFSGREVIGTWTSTGQIAEHEGGMCMFQDDATGNPVYIYGTWVVTIIK